jgi:hypothetical protein
MKTKLPRKVSIFSRLNLKMAKEKTLQLLKSLGFLLVENRGIPWL